MPANLTLHPPGAALESALLPRLAAALEAGDSVWYVVPDSRARGARLRTVSRRVSVLDPPVGTLGDFAARVLRRAGEAQVQPPDPALVWLLQRRALARAFAGHAADEGIARMAGDAMREMEDDGWTGGDVASRLGASDADEAPARLAEAWRRLDEQCPERDAGRPFRRVLGSALAAENAPRLLLIEGGAVAGELSARLLRALVEATLAQGGEVVAACTELPDGRGRHARGLALLRRLLGTDGVAAADAEPSAAPGIAALSRRLFRPAPEAGAEPIASQDVVRLHAPDDEAVADLVAREIRAMLAAAPDPAALLDRGIAVVCPAADDRERVLRALGRLGIPAAREPRMAMAATPAGRWVLALLRPLEDGAAAPASAARALLTGDAWGYPAPAQDAVARRLVVQGAARAGDVPGMMPDGRNRNRLLHVLASAERMRGCATAADCAAVLRDVLPPIAEAGRDEQTRPLRAAWRRHGAVHVSAYAAPLRRLEALVDVLADAEQRTGIATPPPEWFADLRALVESTAVRTGTAPARGVRLESPGRIDRAETVFVVGLVEGRFPGAPRRQPFIPDELRDGLAGAELGPRGVGDAAEEQREAFLLACSAARTRLYLCHPRADADGREVLPSFWIADAAAALGVDELPQVARRRAEVVPALDRAWGPAELRASVASALRDASLGSEARDAVRRAHDDLRREGVVPPSTEPPTWRVAAPGPAERAWLAERSERVSFSQLDAYGHCSFRHFVDARLEPGGLELPIFDERARGSRVHDWLWRLGTTPGGWDDPGPVLDALLAEPEPADTPPSVFAGAGGRAALEQWKRRVRGWAVGEADRIRASAFRPAHHELGFGRRGEGARDPRSRDDALELAVAGAVLRLAGSIDRVDVWTDGGGTRWGIAIDYKTGSLRDRTRRMLDGRDLQLPLYLHVLEAFGIRPAGALYLSVRDGSLAGAVRAEAADAAGPVPSTVQVLEDGDWAAMRARADAQASTLHAAMRGGELRVWPRDGDCGFCAHQGICRVDLRAAREDVRG